MLIDLVLIHKVKKEGESFQFCFRLFLPHIGSSKDLLEIIFISSSDSLTVRWRRSLHFHFHYCERSQSVAIASKIAKKHSSFI